MKEGSIIISHIKNVGDKWMIQSNEEHQQEVAKLAKGFASNFEMAEWGRTLGLLHDLGKTKQAFQQHIVKESGYQPETIVVGDYSHAYVGGIVAKQIFPNHYKLISNILMGHHRGLYDEGDWKELMKKSFPEDIKTPYINTNLSLPNQNYQEKDIHHIIRMLFSCLVDADYLDTEAFMQPAQSALRNSRTSMDELYNKLEKYLDNLNKNASDSEVNKIRRYVQQCCREQSEGAIYFYSLTVPTGGGKTLSSVLWALKHAIKNHLQRIIIAIPYTSIITQTAEVLRNIFGDENVLEHHSNVDEVNDNSELFQTRKLATENWDYPIIVTTNVQLFESLFSNRPSACRKLHNIVKSVLILDEVQTLPVNFLRPIVDTLNTLQRVFDVSVLFTTASQPVLTGKIVGSNKLNSFDALPDIHEIIPKEANLQQKLKRTTLTIDTERSNYDEIAKRLSQHHQVLCIVNTRKDAKEIFNRLPDEGHRLHLSRMMCPDHIRTTIEQIKRLLKSDDKEPLRVVATQLIEAGVDIDFPVVFRQEAGLDSLLQAAGRCNREGKLPICPTYVFSLDKPLQPGHITQTNNARMALGNHQDWFAPETMASYFTQLYSREDNFDKPKIKDLLYNSEMQFETAANHFQLIDDKTTPIIINWKNSMDLVNQLKNKGISYSRMKKLSQFSVNIRQQDFQTLQQAGAIEEILDGIYVIETTSFYDRNVGLITTNQWLEETLIK